MDAIQTIYVALFGRPADPLGLQYFNEVTNGGQDLTRIADLSGSEEFQTRFEGQSNAQIVTSIYQSLFNRLPEQAGLSFFLAQLNSGALNVNNVAVAIAQSAQGTDATILANKVAAANAFTAAIDTPEELNAYQGASALNTAVEFLRDVGADAASVPNQAAVDAAVQELIDGSGVGQNTIVLTNQIDNVLGGSANDIIAGVVNASNPLTEQTLNNGDIINGGEGVDTLRVVATGGTAAPFMTNVENIELNAFVAGTTLNLANSSGVQNITLANGDQSATVNSVGNLVEVGATDTHGGTLTVNYRAGVTSGVNDVQVVNLNNASTEYLAERDRAVDMAATPEPLTNIVTNGVENFAIKATGENNVTLTSGQLKGVTVEGDGDVNITNAFAATVTTFDASKSTGDVKAVFAAGGNVTVTGGAGDDTFDFQGGLTTADKVVGGAGVDTVRVSTSGDFTPTAAAAPLNALSGVERIDFYGANATVNLSSLTNSDLDYLRFNTAGADVVNNANSDLTYEFGYDNGGDATFTLNANSTTLNLALLGSDPTDALADGRDADVGALTVNLNATQPTTAVATVNIDSQGDLNGVGEINNIGAVTAVAGSTFNISGSGALDIASFTNRAIIDASDHTGDLIIEGSQAAANAVSAATLATSGADVITLGDHDAVVQFSSGLDSGITDARDNAQPGSLFVDIINGFTAGAGGDVLEYTTNAAVDSYTAISTALQDAINAPGVTTLEQAADIAVDVAGGGANGSGWTAFNFGGNVYALYDVDGGTGDYVQGTDILVQLTGLSASDLTQDNFA